MLDALVRKLLRLLRKWSVYFIRLLFFLDVTGCLNLGDGSLERLLLLHYFIRGSEGTIVIAH